MGSGSAAAALIATAAEWRAPSGEVGPRARVVSSRRRIRASALHVPKLKGEAFNADPLSETR